MNRWELVHADCLNAMREMDADSIDAVVTDPPYGLSFMGKGWDHGVPGVEFWREALRVAKPGAHLVAFGGTRTFHRLACAIEDAGWEIRDCLSWLYGSGFPKSKNLDGAWQGWGTALKPAWEPIIVARKPLISTVAANVLKHGTGGINIDACRIGIAAGDDIHAKHPHTVGTIGASGIYGEGVATLYKVPVGRWPANVILGCCGNDPHDPDCAVRLLDEQTGTLSSGNLLPSHSLKASANLSMSGPNQARSPRQAFGGDSGGASRFFYTAKASRRERGEGNTHPTVKPVSLMRYLVRLVTPPGGLVLDPFNGSGSTGVASIAEGFRYIGCEREAEYVDISRSRLSDAEELQRILF